MLGKRLEMRDRTSGRKGRKSYAKNAKTKLVEFLLRPLRVLCVLCVRLLVFSALTAGAASAKDTGKLFVSSEKDNALAVIDGLTPGAHHGGIERSPP